nr:hypothetical protein CFP56_70798 [Quercus suber]
MLIMPSPMSRPPASGSGWSHVCVAWESRTPMFCAPRRHGRSQLAPVPRRTPDGAPTDPWGIHHDVVEPGREGPPVSPRQVPTFFVSSHVASLICLHIPLLRLTNDTSLYQILSEAEEQQSFDRRGHIRWMIGSTNLNTCQTRLRQPTASRSLILICSLPLDSTSIVPGTLARRWPAHGGYCTSEKAHHGVELLTDVSIAAKAWREFISWMRVEMPSRSRRRQRTCLTVDISGDLPSCSFFFFLF